MFRMRPPGAVHAIAGPIAGLPLRDDLDHRYDPGGHHHLHDSLGHGNLRPNHPYGVEHLFAKNERPTLVGCGHVGVFDQTGGVMQPVIGTDQPALHFTQAFLKQS